MIVDILIIVGAALGIWLFSHMLSKGTDALGKHYSINPSVRGATLDAVASSFPEFCTVIFALQAGAFEAGVGAISGSALYNILVIPAVSAFVGGDLKIQKEVVRRDGLLYTAVVALLVVAIYFGPEQTVKGHTAHLLPFWVGLAAIAIYSGYVVLLLLQAKKSNGGEPKQQPPQTNFNPVKVAVFVVVGMAGIGAATHFLVDSSLYLFRGLGFSEAIAGVTVLAAATSLPDTLLSVYAVRRGDPDGAVSNAFGSNSFDILICLGLPIFVTGGLSVDWSASWPILTFLLLSTLASVFFLITDWKLSRREAAVMGGLYVLFMVLAFSGVL